MVRFPFVILLPWWAVLPWGYSTIKEAKHLICIIHSTCASYIQSYWVMVVWTHFEVTDSKDSSMEVFLHQDRTSPPLLPPALTDAFDAYFTAYWFIACILFESFDERLHSLHAFRTCEAHFHVCLLRLGEWRDSLPFMCKLSSIILLNFGYSNMIVCRLYINEDVHSQCSRVLNVECIFCWKLAVFLEIDEQE